MHLRYVWRTILGTWGAIVIGAFVTALVRHDMSMKGMIQYVWWISFGIALVGALARGGAGKGDKLVRFEGARDASMDPKGFVRADNEDARRGFAFGTVVLISSGAAFGVSLAVLLHFYPNG